MKDRGKTNKKKIGRKAEGKRKKGYEKEKKESMRKISTVRKKGEEIDGRRLGRGKDRYEEIVFKQIPPPYCIDGRRLGGIDR